MTRLLKTIWLVNLFVLPLSAQLKIEDADNKWFVFNPENKLDEGVIEMTDWLDAPAGKHGFLTIHEGKFRFEDGTPIQFLGTNHSGTQCGPEKEETEKRASWFAKMGINSIRFHKYTYP